MIDRVCRGFNVTTLALLLALGTVADAEGDPIAIRSQPVPLNAFEPSVRGVGRLEYRGGLQLSSDDKRFGGLSGLLVSADGRKLTAISDHGYWITAILLYDRDGGLTGIDRATITELHGVHGKSLAGSPDGDAEDLAWAGKSEATVVSFETRPKLLLYPPGGPSPIPLRTPRELRQAPDNAGIEAITRLANGRLLALTEGLRTENGVIGWVGGSRKSWSRIIWLTSDGFRPTGATTLPDGDVLVLERRILPPGARIRRLPASRIDTDDVLDGEEIARLEGALTFDNMEGIDARSEAGESLVYLVSDDNYSLLQRTLLLMFRIAN
jgi:hypothetical protein